MAESPERDRLRLMTLRSIFGWIKPCNLIAIGTVGSLPLCGTVDLSVNLDAKHLVAWGHVHGDGIQGTGQDVQWQRAPLLIHIGPRLNGKPPMAGEWLNSAAPTLW